MSNAGSIKVADPRTFSKRLRETCLLLCADLPHFVPLRGEFDPARISFDFYSECIDAIRTDAGFDRVVVVGHSHHGNLALEYARRKPDAASHLVLIGTPPVDVATTVQSADQLRDRRSALLERSRVRRVLALARNVVLDGSPSRIS